MKIDGKRVLRTFLQSFFGSLSINIASAFVVDGTKQQIVIAVLSLIGTAITTGIAAIMNIEPAKTDDDTTGDDAEKNDENEGEEDGKI